MSNLEALLLGVVQGLTEFLSISSSGHTSKPEQPQFGPLVLVKNL
jgi:undecaprenyl pyrophosphate phosphatase UppP